MKNLHDSRILDEPEFQSLLVACLESLQRGETIDREALAKDFPQYADEIGQFLEDRQMLEQAAAQFGEVDPLQVSGFEQTVATNPRGNDFAAGETIRYIGEYEILDEIARGGMGIVFKARQQQLNRIVALKMILAGKLADSADVERFHREAQAAGRLKHPNIVPVHEIGEHEGRHYFTMDFVDGQSLSDEIRDEALAPRRAAEIVKTAAEAVHFAHEQGTVHRDLKPANVLLTADGSPHITDFGLAKIMDAVDEDSRAELTATGQILGTPSYMSPEQASGKQQLVGPASDIYSLGAILYACLTGRAPFVADSPVDTLLQVMRNEPVSPRTLNPSVPRDLETICLKCLNKEPHRRYGTAQLLADDLGRFLEGRPVVARPVGAIAKTWRWGKRNPWIAGLLALSVILLVSGTAVASYFAIEADRRADAEAFQHQRADEQTKKAITARGQAEQSLLKEEQARKEAESARIAAEKNRAAAVESRKKAELALANEAAARKLVEQREREARWNEYVARLTVMRRPWEEGEFGQLSRMVEDVRPGVGEPDFRGWEWNYFHDQTEQAALNLGISGMGNDVDWSPDGTRIVTAGTKLEVWDAKSGKMLHQAELGQWLNAVTWNPDNNLLAVGYRDGTAGVYDVEAGHLLRQWKAHDSKTWSIDWSPEGDRIGTGSLDGGAAIWRAETGELIHRLMPNQKNNNKNYLRQIDWNPGNELVAVSHRDGYVRVFDSTNGELKFRRRACGISCGNCAWSADGELLAGGGCFPNNEIIFYTTTGERVGAIPTTSADGQWSPDGKRFATGGNDHDVTIWDVETKMVQRVLRHHSAPVKRLSWSPNSQRLVSVAGDETARVWNLNADTTPSRVIDSGPAAARIVAYSPDGKWIAGGFADKSIRVWDAATGKLTHNFASHTAAVKDLSWSGDSQQVVSICGNNTVWLWDLEKDEALRTIQPKLTGGGVHPWVAWQPRTNSIAMGQLADHTRTYDALTGAILDDGETHTVTGRWSHDGRLLAQPAVSVLNQELKNAVAVKLRHDTCYRLSWAPNDRLLACAGEDGRLRVVDIVTQKVLGVGQGHGDKIRCVAWHPSGARIASGGNDGKIILWDVATLDAVWSAQLPHEVLSLDWSPDGRHLVSSHGNDGQVATKEEEVSPVVRIWGSVRIMPPSQETALLNTAIAQAIAQGERDREVATAILQAGGQVEIAVSGELRSIEVLDDLPAVEFQLTNINLQGVPVEQELLRQLSGGLALHELNLRDTGLTDNDIRAIIGSLPNTKQLNFDVTRREFRIESDGNVVGVLSPAEELNDLTKAVESNPDDAALIRQRGEWYAGQLRWKEALQDFDRAVEVNPNSTWQPVLAARAALMVDDREGFQRRISPLVEKLLRPANSISATTADFIASTAALKPESNLDLSQLLPLAQARSDAKGHARWASRGVIILQLRLGNAEEVLKLVDRYKDEKSASYRIFLDAAEALAYRQLGDAAAAEQALTAAVEQADTAWFEPSEGVSVTYSDTEIYVEAKVFLDEAISLIELSKRVERAANAPTVSAASLLDQLDSETSTVRMEALRTLAKQGAEAAAAVPRLTELLDQSDSLEKAWAVHCLGRIGPQAAAAAPKLHEILNSNAEGKHDSTNGMQGIQLLLGGTPSVEGIRLGAAAALSRMGPASEVAIPTLIEMLRNPGESVKSYLKPRKLGSPAAEGYAAMLYRSDDQGTYTDSRDQYLMFLIGCLANFGPAAEAAVPTIEAVKNNPDTLPMVRELAQDALKKIEGNE